MAKKHKAVINIDESVHFPKGFTISDNRIEDYLQRFLKPSEYCVWRIYLRYWGGDKSVAYPSLAKISKSTGLAEKTIRTGNKELVRKGYLKYRSGCSNRSNQYFYIAVDELMQKYYGADVPKDDPKNIEPIAQHNKIWNEKELSNMYKKFNGDKKIFYGEFKLMYREKMGMDYVPSKADLKSFTALNFSEIPHSTFTELMKTFFHCRNKYIENSDYTMFFFTRSKIQQLLIKEYNQTDEGRWRSQAEKHWEFVKVNIVSSEATFHSREEAKIMIRELLGAKLSSANKARDIFIVDYLIEKLDTQQ